MRWGRPVSFVNARVVCPEREATSLRFRSRILAVDERPRPGDTIVDLDGAFVLPGLINAHDHLELNHYGQLKFRDRYRNASEWIDDMRPRLSSDATIRAGRSQPLAARLFVGGLKNLLSGVTTVAHHNPRYRELSRAVPIRTVARYGWAHSFFLERQPADAHGEPGGDVITRYRKTPADVPFLIHLAEGIDDDARGELTRLEVLGCLASNTVLAHGIAIDADGWRLVGRRGAAFVWCPASNEFLFQRTADIRACLGAVPRVRVALATDSRLSGARDLLDELRVAAQSPVTATELLRMVTVDAADLLRLPSAGRIRPGASADLVVVPARHSEAADTLLLTTRRDVLLVVIGGRPLVALPAFRRLFQTGAKSPARIRVDGVERLADQGLAKTIARCPIGEPGVACVSM